MARLRGRFGARRIDVVLGGAMLATAVLIGAGGFTDINRRIAENIDLTSTPIASIERSALDRAQEGDLAAVRHSGSGGGGDRPSDEELDIAGWPESEPGELARYGDAPELAKPNRTYNLPDGVKLDKAYLEGKVVVYDFWTYSCINCIRTLPYLRRMHERYADDGLVIVGVHAPEFAFEKDESNVAEAIDDLDVTWPVATDPELETWENFDNRYWPAKYVVDRSGELRYVHYGEGAYEETEAVIRELLGQDPAAADMPAEPDIDYVANTPETYLGHLRMADGQWRGRDRETNARIAAGPGDYVRSGDGPLERDQYTLEGPWLIEDERSLATGQDAEIVIHYRARRVYLVLDPGDTKRPTVTVRDGDERPRTVAVDAERLYTLRDGDETADATMRIEVPEGVSAYAFTFG